MSLRDEVNAAVKASAKKCGPGSPEFLFAVYLQDCLTKFDELTVSRESWFGRPPLVIPLKDL